VGEACEKKTCVDFHLIYALLRGHRRSRSRVTRRRVPTPRTPRGTRCQTARSPPGDAPRARCHGLRPTPRRRPCCPHSRGSRWPERLHGTGRTGRSSASWSGRWTLATSRLARRGRASARVGSGSREGARHRLALRGAVLCPLSSPRFHQLHPHCCCCCCCPCRLDHRRPQHRKQGDHRVGRELRTFLNPKSSHKVVRKVNWLIAGMLLNEQASAKAVGPRNLPENCTLHSLHVAIVCFVPFWV